MNASFIYSLLRLNFNKTEKEERREKKQLMNLKKEPNVWNDNDVSQSGKGNIKVESRLKAFHNFRLYLLEKEKNYSSIFNFRWLLLDNPDILT